MHKAEIILFFKNLWQKLKSFLFTRDGLIFLLFVLIAFGFWVLNAINKVYEVHVSFPVHYANVPKEVELTTELPSTIDVKIKDKGSVLFVYQHKHFIPMVVNFGDYSSHSQSDTWSISTSNTFEKAIKKQLNPSSQIVDYYPRSIVIEKQLLNSKIVPVVPQTQLEYAKQYYPSGQIIFEPESVKVYGYQEILDTLEVVRTKTIEGMHLKDTLRTTVALDLPKHCKSDPPEIDVTIPIEFYTEGQAVIPVKVKNLPKNIRVRTFPHEVKVTYLAGVSYFKSILPTDFEITIDYKKLLRSDSKTEELTLVKTPERVYKPKLSPSKVQWIIEFIQ